MGGNPRPLSLPRCSWRERAVALTLFALLLLATGLAAAAYAQDPTETLNEAERQLSDPGNTCAEQLGGENDCDTEYTPVAKTTKLWTRIGGAEYSQGGPPELPEGGSPTPLAADLFAVSFRNLFNGFFGGDRCEDRDADGDELASCTRVPVIYRYSQEPGRDGEIEEVFSAPGQGYVAAIAWLGPDRALAVGGSGAYPRREPGAAQVDVPAEDPTGASVSPPQDDPAGEARAWLYQNGNWEEITDELPEGMGALTALDVAPNAFEDCGPEATECAFAGGLRQIWRWQDGGFSEQPFTPTSTDELGNPTVTHGSEWLFRVRQLRFSPEGGPTAVAVTSGCCGLDPANNVARLLVYDAATGRWDVRLLYDGSSGVIGPVQTLPDSYPALTFAGENQQWLSVVASPGGPEQPGEPASRIVGVRSLGDERLKTEKLTDPNQAPGELLAWGLATAVASPQGIALGIASGRAHGNTDVPYELVNPNLSTVRLTAGDGDLDFGPEGFIRRNNLLGAGEGPDGLMDWGVGVLRSTGQGIAYTTAARAWGLDPPVPVKCPDAATSTECQPDAEAAQEQARSRALLGLDTYALNGFQLIGDSGVGWAVGDKGAVARLGGEGTVGTATPPPPPPALGSPSRATPGASQPYDDFRGGARGSGPAGPVPALAERPLEQLDSPRFIAAGSPDTRVADLLRSDNDEEVEQIVMSRDGSEGWAIGPGNGGARMTLYRYSGNRWQRCHVESLPGVLEPDPACEALAPLWKAGVKITAAARVPLERDGDPSNDDELEIVAAGTSYADPDQGGAPTDAILRYRDGRWEIDRQAMEEIDEPDDEITDIAFVRPDDGWLLVDGGQSDFRLYHFDDDDGDGWRQCEPGAVAQAECGDADDLIPFKTVLSSAPPHLAIAGERVYLYGTKQVGSDQTSVFDVSARFPFIFYKDPDGAWRGDDGAYDPANAPGGSTAAEQGELFSLSVVRHQDGSFSGWALGRSASGGEAEKRASGLTGRGDRSALLSQGPGLFRRLGPCGSEWEQFDPGRVREYLPPEFAADEPRVVSFFDTDAKERAVLTLNTRGSPNPLLAYESADGCDGGTWRVLPTPFTMAHRPGNVTSPTGQGAFEGEVRALAPDGRGGFWMAAEGHQAAPSTYFYRWADRAPRPVFGDVAHPIREPITSGAAGPDGRLWAATASGRLYVHDRVTGWDSVEIEGWDRGRVVTRASQAGAVAIGPDGSGVVVGENGRIAEIDPGGGVTLDPAAALSCGGSSTCSVTNDLRAAAVAPDDGSALVGGERRALSFRSGAGEFRTVTPPATSLSATITGISMPSSGRAWLVTDTGDIFSGDPASGDWQLESLTPDGDPLARTLDDKRSLSLNAISVDAGGHGYAVGDDGLILERDPDGGASPWHRIAAGYLDDFQSLHYQPGGGILIGGESGLILTGEGRSFSVARPADYFDPFSTARSEREAARMVAVTATRGPDGGTEAWALSQASSADGARSPAPGQVLHYSSDPADPLLSAAAKAEPLPDVPAVDSNDLTIAAFGKSDCQLETGQNQVCPEPTGSNLANEVITARVRDEILARSERPDGPELALFTGDVNQTAGSGYQKNTLNSPVDPSVIHHRWVEFVADRFADPDDGLPLFGALGGQDLSHAQTCPAFGLVCASTHQSRTGSNFGWREALAGMPAPWGSGEGGSTEGISIAPVSGSGGSIEGEDVKVSDPSGSVGDRTVPAGGARTHYAFDVERGGQKVARIAVLDSSLRSLEASDPLQNPIEATGQLKWLADLLCRPPQTTATGEPCTRAPGQRAVVVSNTPTYSYGPGALSDTQADGTALESVLFANDVDLVVSGRLGWNALYWAMAPGLHCPKAGDPQPDPNSPPTGPECAAATDSTADEAIADAQTTVGEAIGGDGEGGGSNGLPFVIAASAGGKFGPDGSASGSSDNGFWHGYTIVHLEEDTGEVSVEHRPVFDWIGIRPAPTAGNPPTHVLRANKRLALEGFGREPVGIDQPARYDEINSHAITHRYDLLAADPSKPWLPATDESPPSGLSADGPGSCGP
ncbi:MAG: hypothetical protein ACRDL6_01915, partial [Solirubrobacterales bacterium]